MRNIYLLVIFVSVCLSACTPPVEVTRTVHKLPDGIQPPTDAVIYGLPRTVLQIMVEVEKEIRKKGPFYAYRSKYLGQEDGIADDLTAWRISNIEISSFEEPDPGQFYVIEPSELAYSNYLQMTKAGLVLSLDPGLYKRMPAELDIPLSEPRHHFFTDQSVKRNMAEYKDTLYRLVETDTAFIRVPYVDLKVRYKNADEKAGEAANFIIKIRKRRFKLMSGQYEGVYPEGIALEYAVKELTRLENEYMALFLGKTIIETYTQSFQYVPVESETEDSAPLFRFSNDEGILPADDIDGKPIMLRINSIGIMAGLNSAEHRPDSVNRADLIYRVPDPSVAEIVDGIRSLSKKRVLIYQRGKIMRLPGKFRLSPRE